MKMAAMIGRNLLSKPADERLMVCHHCDFIMTQ